MNITLEQIDEVINRTGATYHQAKEALQFTDGDVVEAIIYLETMKKDQAPSDRPYFNGEEIIGLLKDMIKKGNVTRITLEKNNKIVVDIPILAGALGALIFTSATVASILAALVAGCDLKIIKDDGEIIDVKEYTEHQVDRVKDRFSRADHPDMDDDFNTAEADAEAAEMADEDYYKVDAVTYHSEDVYVLEEEVNRKSPQVEVVSEEDKKEENIDSYGYLEKDKEPHAEESVEKPEEK